MGAVTGTVVTTKSPALAIGTQPKCVHTPSVTRKRSSCTRSSSRSGSRNVLNSTARTCAISSGVRCLTKSGLPLHLIVTLFPSGMAVRSTSACETANTSALALIVLNKSCRKFLPACAPSTPTPPTTRYVKPLLDISLSELTEVGSLVESLRYEVKSGTGTSVCAKRFDINRNEDIAPNVPLTWYGDGSLDLTFLLACDTGAATTRCDVTLTNVGERYLAKPCDMWRVENMVLG